MGCCFGRGKQPEEVFDYDDQIIQKKQEHVIARENLSERIYNVPVDSDINMKANKKHQILDDVQLCGYFERIGLSCASKADFVPNPETLARLMHGHVSHIPFSNCSVLLEQTRTLFIPDIVQRLVFEKRGGCCFEQNSLFKCVLQTLGFTVNAHKGMMRLHLRNDEEESDRSHLFLIVTFGQTKWISDVALGSLSMSCPVRIDVGIEQITLEGPRLVSEASFFPLRFSARRSGGKWRAVYDFDPEKTFSADLMENERSFASSVESDLATRLIISRCDESLNRITLRNLDLYVKDINGKEISCDRIQTASDFSDTLETKFRFNFAPEESDQLFNIVESLQESKTS